LCQSRDVKLLNYRPFKKAHLSVRHLVFTPGKLGPWEIWDTKFGNGTFKGGPVVGVL